MNKLNALFLSDNKSAESIIDDVMSGSEFHGNDPVKIEWLKELLDKFFEFLEKIMEKLIEWIAKVLEFLGIGKNTGDSSINVGAIVGLIFAVLLAGLLIFLVVKIIIYFSKKGFTRKEKDDFQEELIQYADNPDEPYNVSKKFYDENNMKMAFRYLFIAMLVRFNKKEVIFIHKSKINRIYRAEILKAGCGISSFSDPFFDAFDLSWYGGRNISKGEMDSWYEKYDEFFKDFDKLKINEENDDEKT